MKYTKLGHSGLLVSKLSLGAMTFGAGFMGIGKLDQKGADELVAMALDTGINFFDTANVYSGGESETILGKALGAKRKDVVIATKVGSIMPGAQIANRGLSRRNIIANLDASLQRLGTDWIDVYIMHRPDYVTPLEETLAALDEVMRAGKVRYLGFSNWPAWMAAKAIGIQEKNGYSRFVTGQMYYSLVSRDLEQEIVPFCLDAGIGVMVWSPLAGGFLSGKYTREDPKGGGGRLANFNLVPLDMDKAFAVLDTVRDVAKARGVSPSAISLAWLMRRPAIATVLAGASSAAQMADNLKAAELVLSAEEMETLDKASKLNPLYPHWFLKRVPPDPLAALIE